MSEKKIKATAIVLAGGKSTRMEGTDKSMLLINGVPLIKYVVSQVEDYFEEVIIGSNDREKYAFLNHRIVPDIRQGNGPLMGLLSCLRASSNEINFVTACDIPVLNIEFIRKMIALSSENKIVMPLGDTGKYEPLFAVYHRSVADIAEEILNSGSRKVIDLLGHGPFLVDFKGEDWYRNINTREDLAGFLNSAK